MPKRKRSIGYRAVTEKKREKKNIQRSSEPIDDNNQQSCDYQPEDNTDHVCTQMNCHYYNNPLTDMSLRI